MTAARLDRSRSEPLWAQLLDDLRERLASGEFERGFPTDRALVEQYDVSRHTVRDAVRRLQADGVLERERGRGSFVRHPHVSQHVGPLYSLFASIEAQGYVARNRVLATEERADVVVAEQLGLAPGAALVHLRRLRSADDAPIAVDDLWLPADIGRPLLAVDLEHTAVYAELERLSGVRPTSGWERIHPGVAGDDGELLGVGSGDPVFVVERRTEAEGDPIEWRRTVVRGDRYTFVTTWSGPTPTGSHFSPRGR